MDILKTNYDRQKAGTGAGREGREPLPNGVDIRRMEVRLAAGVQYSGDFGCGHTPTRFFNLEERAREGSACLKNE